MVFPKWTNRIPGLLVGLATVSLCGVVFIAWYWGSPKHINVGYQPVQPILYSHKVHAGQVGLDCRYCHTHVERSRHAGVPGTEVCMNCHTFVKAASPLIQQVKAAHDKGVAIPWVRVHKIADFASFDHSAHVNKGVSCVSCHGRVDQMDEVRMEQPLSMGWCLECHRNPAPNIRDRKKVTDLAWKPEGDPAALGREFMKLYNVHPRTDCSACHR